MKIAHYWLPALLLASCSGCITVQDCIDNCVIDCRNRCYAERAWLRCRSNYSDVECKCDFAKGFKDGYAAVASGASTCQPALPPQSYWHFEYQNPGGQERALAWFNGYSYGAIYAEQEGISDWSRIVTAPTLPPYRKKRPPRQTSSATPDVDMSAPSVYEGAEPYSQPVPPDEPPAASASTRPMGDPIADDENAAKATAVRWTDGADAY